MLKWAIIFLVISLVAGFLVSAGISATAQIAKVLFVIFLVIFVITPSSSLSPRRCLLELENGPAEDSAGRFRHAENSGCPHQQPDDGDQQDQPEDAARPISPAAAVSHDGKAPTSTRIKMMTGIVSKGLTPEALSSAQPSRIDESFRRKEFRPAPVLV
jgi:uncharacterized membrane protein YtjA (UPF0391 family)